MKIGDRAMHNMHLKFIAEKEDFNLWRIKIFIKTCPHCKEEVGGAYYYNDYMMTLLPNQDKA